MKIKKYSDVSNWTSTPKKRKINLTIGFVTFGQILNFTHALKQPTTPYTVWINTQCTKSHACDKFVTNS